MTRRAEEFRRQAQECFDLARAISLKTERAILIDIAQTYLRLAKQEAQEEIIPPPVTKRPQPVAQQQEQIQPKDDDTKEIDRLSWRPLSFQN